MFTYEIELLPAGNGIGFNLLDDEDFTIPHVTDTIPSLPAGHKLPTQAKKKLGIIAINKKDPITTQGVLDKPQHRQNYRGKPNTKIIICRRKIYQRTDIEEIFSRFINSDLWFHIVNFVSQRY